jgi:hypothetical protein
METVPFTALTSVLPAILSTISKATIVSSMSVLALVVMPLDQVLVYNITTSNVLTVLTLVITSTHQENALLTNVIAITIMMVKLPSLSMVLVGEMVSVLPMVLPSATNV